MKKHTRKFLLQSLFWGWYVPIYHFRRTGFRDDLHEVNPIRILKRLVIWLLAGARLGFIGYYIQRQKHK